MGSASHGTIETTRQLLLFFLLLLLLQSMLPGQGFFFLLS